MSGDLNPRLPGAGVREPEPQAAPGTPHPEPVSSLRCPRCGSRLGAQASQALARARQAQAAGRQVAVRDDAPFCGCCGLLIATEG